MTLLDVMAPFKTTDLNTSDESGSTLITRKIIGLLSEVLSEIKSGSWNERGGMNSSSLDAILEDSLAKVASVLYHLEQIYMKESLSYPPMFVEQLLNAYPFSFTDKPKELKANFDARIIDVTTSGATFQYFVWKAPLRVQRLQLLENVLKTLLADERINLDETADAFLQALLRFNHEESLSRIAVHLLQQNCLESQRIWPWIETLKDGSINDFEAQAITILRKRNQLPSSMLVES
ncbi:hypothetical protein TCAL_17024 [Tigriopus californicus]|uniref:Uncharacterized protein n=1 Tax=Tigriopus californicus TaxID=6832 RepID=A0A553PFS7_TIGCA|nr:hypothetical protein TCAL_17024 [Tigriopus californicus]